MKKLFFYFLLVTSFYYGKSQSKVASYSFGKLGTENYENISFWIENGKRTDITYSYGASQEEIKLKYVEKALFKGDSGFKVQFPNKYTLYVIPKGFNLKVNDENEKYLKIFTWEYEGTFNGIGTFCEPCAEGKEDAMRIIKTNYLR